MVRLTHYTPILLAFAIAAWALPTLGAEPHLTEESLISVLTSESSSDAEKDDACAKLKLIGTDKSVPALAKLLPDQKLSHSARYALETIPGPQAGQALVEALQNTEGRLRAGVIHALEVRRETQAVAPLGRLLDGQDIESARASASALGEIGTPESAGLLRKGYSSANSNIRPAVLDGLLRCAARLHTTRDLKAALEAASFVCDNSEHHYFKKAGYAALIQSSEPGSAEELFSRGLKNENSPEQGAALSLAASLPVGVVRGAIIQSVRELKPSAQAALVDALALRGDPEFAATAASLLDSPAVEVRRSAIRTLGQIGSGSHGELLLKRAAESTGDEQKAAREALARLRGADDQLIALLESGSAPIKTESARALGARGSAKAIRAILQITRNASAEARPALLVALQTLAKPEHLDELIALVSAAPDTAGQTQAAEALNAAIQQWLARGEDVSFKPVVTALTSGSKATRVALMPIGGGIVHPEVRQTLRAAAQDRDSEIRTAAIRAMCDSRDVELAPDLISIVSRDQDKTLRRLATAAAVRLLVEDGASHFNHAQKAANLKQLLGGSAGAEERTIVLSGLGEVPHRDALALTLPLVKAGEGSAEAARATLKIATMLSGSDADTALDALKAIQASHTSGPLHEQAGKAIAQLEARLDYLTAWQVAGPFSQDGKNFAALFDVEFPPEREGEKVNWQRLEPGGATPGPAQAVTMDLLKKFGGEQRVAYVRTSVSSPEDQAAILELGSDDGAKVWANGTLVHANNVARPLQPGSDKVEVTLKKGWNPLVMKITQNNLGWEFTARLVKQDGTRLSGIRADASR